MPRPARAYYPAIDGLRAIAVLSVVCFHATAFPASGFVGVDVFFVISGFVVSLSMASVRAEGFAGFTTFFYARRLLRIAPALIVCLLATTFAACLFIPEAWLSEGNLKAGLSAFFGFSNVVLARSNNDYFSPKAEFNPFTHTWSLGVEEQFYVVFPLLMYLFLRKSQRDKGKRSARVSVVLLSIASLALCAWWTWRWPPNAFYLTPARFWELGCGVGLFMSREHWQPWLAHCSPAGARGIGYAAMAVLGMSLLLIAPSLFPFPSAMAPVAGTTVLLALTFGRDDRATPGWLTSAPAVWVGKISYSLYLWHWPVFVLFRWTIGIETLATKLLALALSFGLAALSFRFVERPLRESSRMRKWPRARVVGAGLAAVLLAAGIAAIAIANESRISLSVTRDTLTWLPDSDIRPAGETPMCRLAESSTAFEGGAIQRFVPSQCTPTGSRGRLVVAGDSHAMAYTGMLRLVAERSGRELQIISKADCPIFGLDRPMREAKAYCKGFAVAALREISARAESGDTLFLPSLRVPRFGNQWGDIEHPPAPSDAAASRQAAMAEAAEFLGALSTKGVSIVFEAPLPVFKAPSFRCSDWFNARNPVCSPGFEVDRAAVEQIRAPVLASMREVSARLAGSTIWDPLPVVCPGATCGAFRNGLPLFSDGDHLSGLGNSVLVESFARHLP